LGAVSFEVLESVPKTAAKNANLYEDGL